MTQPAWDDDRLDAAFHARFDRPAPPVLVHDVHVRIAGTSPTRFRIPSVGQPWSLAAALVIVILVFAGTVGRAALSLPAGSQAPVTGSTSGPSATAAATPTLHAVSESILGLPIIGVPDAMTIRDGGVDDHEIAVQGWFTPPAFTCQDGSINPILADCGDETVGWLTEDPETLVRATRTGVDRVAPQGAAIAPILIGLPDFWYPDLPLAGSGTASVPVDVVLVGHFDDRRAVLCTTSQGSACRDRFVVDKGALGKLTKVAEPASQFSRSSRIIAFRTRERRYFFGSTAMSGRKSM